MKPAENFFASERIPRILWKIAPPVMLAQLIQALYEYYMDQTDQMPVEYRRMFESGKEKKGRVVCDYIAGMSDGYAIDRFEELFVPKAWKAH